MERQNQQLVNLVTLFDSVLSPAVARLAALDENQQLALIEHATGSVIEAFGWYRIAVASGFIPIHESEIVLSTYAAYAGRNQNVQRWRDSFSNEFLGWLEGGITSRRFFGHDDWRFEDGESVWPVLQTTATLAGDFASEGTSQCFVLALNFLSDDEWANLVSSPLAADVLIELFASNETDITLNKESCFVGFFNTLSHFAASKRLSAHLQGDQAISPVDRGTLRRCIVEVQTWRASNKRPMVKARLNEFAAYGAKMMIQDIRIRNLGLVEGQTDFGDFIKIVDDLVVHWDNFGTPMKGAEA